MNEYRFAGGFVLPSRKIMVVSVLFFGCKCVAYWL